MSFGHFQNYMNHLVPETFLPYSQNCMVISMSYSSDIALNSSSSMRVEPELHSQIHIVLDLQSLLLDIIIQCTMMSVDPDLYDGQLI